MNAVIQSIGCLFSNDLFPSASEPDKAPQLFGKPTADFILCRDKNGSATAVYGEPIWDFNPYRLSAVKIPRIRFDTVFDESGPEQRALTEEAKYLLYCLISFAGGGRLGKLGASTLLHYWLLIRAAMQFCYDQKRKPVVGILSLRQLFTVPVYLAAFGSSKGHKKKALTGFLSCLVRVGEERLGYSVLNPATFKCKRFENKQHPVIPTRIYLKLINLTGDLLDQLFEGVERFDSFIACFADESYGICYQTQRSRGVGGRAHWRPDMAKAISDHGLASVFVGEFECSRKRNLQRVLIQIQYVLKTVIHLYTGMRDQEVMRIPYDCLSNQVVRSAVVDEKGIERDKPQSVNVLSTTTKFIGYKRESLWFAPQEVVRAIRVAQAICRGLAKLYKIDLGARCPLFLNPAIVGITRNNFEIGVTRFPSRAIRETASHALTIQAEDVQELAQSDPTRDFYNEPNFAIGQPWPLTSHQFRRSLAFYGSSSGFLSLPTLRAQFKHMTIEMARYYANGYDNLRTIFGYYDDKQKDFLLPSNHFAFEYQMAMPISVANQLIADLLFNDEPLFGGTGSYMEKQKERVKLGMIQIADVRAHTEQRIRNGEISYRSTLLGGCSKVGRCDSFLLGDYVKCMSCENGIIKPDKINAAIRDAADELCNYAEGSGEYQILKSDIERLTAFKIRLINPVGINDEN